MRIMYPIFWIVLASLVGVTYLQKLQEVRSPDWYEWSMAFLWPFMAGMWAAILLKRISE